MPDWPLNPRLAEYLKFKKLKSTYPFGVDPNLWVYRESNDKGSYKSSFNGPNDLDGGAQCDFCNTWHRYEHICVHPDLPGEEKKLGPDCAWALTGTNCYQIERAIQRYNRHVKYETAKQLRDATKAAEAKRLADELEQQRVQQEAARLEREEKQRQQDEKDKAARLQQQAKARQEREAGEAEWKKQEAIRQQQQAAAEALRRKQEVAAMIACAVHELERQRHETPEETAQREREAAARTVVAEDSDDVRPLHHVFMDLEPTWCEKDVWATCGQDGASYRKVIDFGPFTATATIYPSRFKPGLYCYTLNVPAQNPIKQYNFQRWESAAKAVYDTLVGYCKARAEDFVVDYV